MTQTYTVFISYSWTTPKHEDWVINLAERLMADGINVIIDKWNLKEGHDKYSFMESMVKSTEVNKVLIILDKRYSEKAEERSGGVGTETQIISPQIYSDVSQEKFIPIIAERDENGREYLPTFLKTRIYIDLSSPEHFETNYEKLLRNIYQRPAFTKPKIGNAPSYLFEEVASTHKTASILRSFDSQIEKLPNKANSIIKDFLTEYFDCLGEYSISTSGKNQMEIAKDVIDSLNKYSVLRNDFIFFFDKISKPELQFDIEILIKFLERLPLLKYPLDDRGTWSSSEFDIFRFIIHELFLYIIAISLKNENYKLLEEIFYSSFFFQDKFDRSNEPKRFDVLYNHIEVFDAYYKQTYSKNFFSPMADFIVKRAPDSLSKDQLVDADLLCFHIAQLNNLRWFPITYVYKSDRKPEFFSRLQSLRHFEKIKIIFNVNTVQELKDILNKLKLENTSSHRVAYSNSFDSVAPIYQLIDIEKIGLTR